MTEEQFIGQVSPLPEGSQYYYVRPDSSLDEYAFCRAYILIPNLEDQLLFRDKFDNYIFLDSLGGKSILFYHFQIKSKVFIDLFF